MNPKTKIQIGTAIPILVSFAIWLLLLYCPPLQLINESKLAILFYGLGKLTLIFGFIVYVTFCAWQQYVLSKKQTELDQTELEINFRKESLSKQMEDAIKRRQHDQLLHHDNALARLLESATINNEDTSEPVKLIEEPQTKGEKVFYREKHTRNTFNKEAFQKTLDIYTQLYLQQSKTP